MKHLLFAVMLTLLVTVCSGGFAQRKAVVPPTPKTPATGKFTAKGDGMLNLQVLKGTVELVGNGTLLTNAKQVTFTGSQGTREEKKDKNGRILYVIYRGFKGTAVITGERFILAFSTQKMQVKATGIGRGTLAGKGTYLITKVKSRETQSGIWGELPKPSTTPQANKRHKIPEVLYFGDFPKPQSRPGTTKPPSQSNKPVTPPAKP